MTDVSQDYSKKIEEQINQYAETLEFPLPDIFYTWVCESVIPGLQDVFGVDTINDMYRNAVIESASIAETCDVLSLGCGDGLYEVDLAESLIQTGFTRFKIHGAELSPILVEKMKSRIQEKQLLDYVFVEVCDLNINPPVRIFDMIMANQSLHHIVNLENTFDYCKAHMTDAGIFATCDMIGRNGHMRWPEAAIVLQILWPFLSEKQRYHSLLNRQDEKFNDHDCSTYGFEGVRAQDILPLILERFHSFKFHCYGGFIDVLVERGYGPGFDINSEKDRNFVLFLSRLNDMMLDAGVVKPTSMCAWFTKDQRPEKTFHNRRARDMVRRVEPSWVQFYQQFYDKAEPAGS